MQSTHTLYGAVVFDDITLPKGGWASIHGKPAFRVGGTGDLASDIYWWTNLPYGTLNKYNISKPSIKRADYFRPDMEQLHQELGLLPIRMTGQRIAEISGEIFDRVMRLANEHYGLDKPIAATLSEDLYRFLLPEDRPTKYPELDNALTQAFQTWVMCESVAPTGAKNMTFKRPRIPHALEVLSTPIPGPQWELIEGQQMPPESQRLDWLTRQSRPVLAKVSVSNVQPAVAPIITFAGGSDRERSWMSHPELLAFSKFAKVRVDAAFMGVEYQPQQVDKLIVTEGNYGLLSISTGILAENYWVSLASSHTLRKNSKENRLILHSARAVWFTAADRFQMMMAALLMHGSGFRVKGYGRGKILVSVQRGALKEARACATAAGLNSPLHVKDEIEMQSGLSG